MARDDKAARYREAAQLTLEQLDWCIEYFNTIRKPKIAKIVAHNRAAIAHALEEGDQVSAQSIPEPARKN